MVFSEGERRVKGKSVSVMFAKLEPFHQARQGEEYLVDRPLWIPPDTQTVSGTAIQFCLPPRQRLYFALAFFLGKINFDYLLALTCTLVRILLLQTIITEAVIAGIRGGGVSPLIVRSFMKMHTQVQCTKLHFILLLILSLPLLPSVLPSIHPFCISFKKGTGLPWTSARLGERL